MKYDFETITAIALWASGVFALTGFGALAWLAFYDLYTNGVFL